jgi:flagellar biosynthesis/type III secretory pathway chaperone
VRQEPSPIVTLQLGWAERLLDTLEAERMALIERDLHRLADLGPQKLALLLQLQEFGRTLVSRHAPRPDATSPGRPRLPNEGKTWQQLRSLIERCDQANRFNQALLQARQAQLRVAMTALQPQHQTSYGPRGSANGPLTGRLRDRA